MIAAAVLAALCATWSASASDDGPAGSELAPITADEARRAVVIDASEAFVAFTEHRPRIWTACRELSARRAACAVRVRGDRIHVQYCAVVALIESGDFLVTASRLGLTREDRARRAAESSRRCERPGRRSSPDPAFGEVVP